MLTHEEILVLYDQEQRIEVEYPGVRREVTDLVVRHIDVAGQPGKGFVVYSRLTAENADRAIDEQIAYFESIGQSFEWKLYDHDQPEDLRERLIARGFEIEEPEAIMALDLNEAPELLLQPVMADIRRVSDPAQIADVISVQKQVWNRDFANLRARLESELAEQPDYVSIYLAYVDAMPVCSAWINFHPNSQFASLWGGSTLPAYRRRGIYTAMVAVRTQEALRRGYRFLTIDASPMSRPIVARLGFRLLTFAHACNWRVSRS